MSGEHKAWKRTFWVSALLSILLVASLAPYLTSSTELVRLRNSLLYEPVAADASWTPANPPEGFLLERAPPTEHFGEIVSLNGLAVPGDDWQTALNIGRHLLIGVVAHGGSGGAVQAGLSETYRRITQKGEGYCGDFVDSFTALATTAGLFSRSWAFSFDGFGGHGHIFNEVWDRQAQAWRMIDVFNNYYVVDARERPVSALEFRQRLLDGSSIEWRAIEARARPGFVLEDKALDYYRRGAHQWYLWWGNNAFEYDDTQVVALFGMASPALSQISAIAIGVHPPIRVVADPVNEPMQAHLSRLGRHLSIVALVLPVLGVLMIASFRNIRRRQPQLPEGAC